jgi:hypothetical protein
MMTVLNGGAVSNLTVGIGDELIVSSGGIASGSSIFADSVGRPVANM